MLACFGLGSWHDSSCVRGMIMESWWDSLSGEDGGIEYSRHSWEWILVTLGVGEVDWIWVLLMGLTTLRVGDGCLMDLIDVMVGDGGSVDSKDVIVFIV